MEKTAKCYNCGKKEARFEFIKGNTYKCKHCEIESVICPGCSKTDNLMPEDCYSDNFLCTKCKIVVPRYREILPFI